MLTPKQREEKRQRLLIFGARCYRCPNSGVILCKFNDHDDKILCGCGEPNPACRSSESGYQYDGRYYHFTGAHIIRCLPAATLDEYLDQGPEGAAFRDREIS